MPWGALADDFCDHPTIISIGNYAAGVYARAISYCARYLTDGVIPRDWLEHAAGRRQTVASLIDQGLLLDHGNVLVLRDYLHYNPSRAEVEERRWRDANKKRQQRGQEPLERPNFEAMSPLLDHGLSPDTLRNQGGRVPRSVPGAVPHPVPGDNASCPPGRPRPPAGARDHATPTPPQGVGDTQRRTRPPGRPAPGAPQPGYDTLHPALRAAYPRERLERHLADPDCRVDNQGRIHLGPYLLAPHLYPQEPA